MKTLIKLFKFEMTLISLIIALLFWGLSMSFLAFQNKSQVLLIGKTKEGFKLIKADDETQDKGSLEALNFIRHFIGLTFNYDSKSYVRHISLAGDLMSENLWDNKEPEFKKQASFIKKNKISQSSELLSVTRKSNQYEVEVINYLFKNGNLTKGNKIIILSLTHNQRSFENPWRYNVSDFKIK